MLNGRANHRALTALLGQLLLVGRAICFAYLTFILWERALVVSNRIKRQLSLSRRRGLHEEIC
jgi:hypothetical protein